MGGFFKEPDLKKYLSRAHKILYEMGQDNESEAVEQAIIMIDSTSGERTEKYEKEIKEKGLTAPRVTPERLEEVIKKERYHVFEGTTTTVCCLILENGFTVVGESACASPENFNAELGRKIARDNAKNKIWALEGYALKERLTK